MASAVIFRRCPMCGHNIAVPNKKAQRLEDSWDTTDEPWLLDIRSPAHRFQSIKRLSIDDVKKMDALQPFIEALKNRLKYLLAMLEEVE